MQTAEIRSFRTSGARIYADNQAPAAGEASAFAPAGNAPSLPRYCPQGNTRGLPAYLLCKYGRLGAAMFSGCALRAYAALFFQKNAATSFGCCGRKIKHRNVRN